MKVRTFGPSWVLALLFMTDIGFAAVAEGVELTADDILRRHIAAQGGALTEQIDNVRIRVNVTEPGFTVTGDYRATSEGYVRVDVFAEGKRVFSEGIDEQGGWQQSGPGADVMSLSTEGYAALARGADFNIFGLHRLAARGHNAELHGQQRVDGVLYHVIEVTMADGFRRHFYINPANWLIERTRETSALHPDLDASQRPAETVYTSFERHCGMLRSMASRKSALDSGEELQRTLAQSVQCNAEVETLGISRPGTDDDAGDPSQPMASLKSLSQFKPRRRSMSALDQPRRSSTASKLR